MVSVVKERCEMKKRKKIKELTELQKILINIIGYLYSHAIVSQSNADFEIQKIVKLKKGAK
jgi:hypothetical protein